MRYKFVVAVLFSVLVSAQTVNRTIADKVKFCNAIHQFPGKQFDVAYWRQTDSESDSFRDELRQTISQCGWADTNAPEYDLRAPLRGIVVHYANDSAQAATALVSALTAQGLKAVTAEPEPNRTNPGLSIVLGMRPK